MTLRLRTPKFLRKLASKYVSKLISEDSGYDINIQINEMEIGMRDKRVYARMGVGADIDRKDLMRIVKNSVKDAIDSRMGAIIMKG